MSGDFTAAAASVIEAARARGVMLATAESCTGGMIGAALTDIAGASDVFDRGFITYSNEAKTQMLGVLPATLRGHGAVSEEVAAEMAEGARRNSAATLAVAVTGVAGPGSSGPKPEGRVCFGISTPAGTSTETVEFGAIGRDAVRRATVARALALLLAALGSERAK
ncbi:CinA family protein [Paracoccus alkenifer]|uniref:Nicotinamide-nucleotide amidase n=1 Tax=Paracoccus alkenifer TaxID=65735 RepID=A0A1H6M136_9RHOB|nr:CinA family protein [Paracoccus alkenifer]SEH90926.1 nicotinamide-nucleotide amidase [Paracoccus alkenifer]